VAASIRVATADPPRVRITQITDVHLFDDIEGRLLGLNTQDSFEAVMDVALAEAEVADIILATGDLAQEPSAASYGRLAQHFERFGKPVFWLPGNHDQPELMAEALRGPNLHPHKQILAGAWQILMLDSSVPGKVYGELTEDQLGFLDSALHEYPKSHALVVLHHQPVPVGSRWLDTIGLRNSEAFFEILARHPQARLVLWGHVHQAFEGRHARVDLLSTPSSCVQFKPGSEDFAAGTEAPGYRVLDLFDDGRWQSAVRRIEHLEFVVDYSIKGY